MSAPGLDREGLLQDARRGQEVVRGRYQEGLPKARPGLHPASNPDNKAAETGFKEARRPTTCCRTTRSGRVRRGSLTVRVGQHAPAGHRRRRHDHDVRLRRPVRRPFGGGTAGPGGFNVGDMFGGLFNGGTRGAGRSAAPTPRGRRSGCRSRTRCGARPSPAAGRARRLPDLPRHRGEAGDQRPRVSGV